MSVKEWWPVSEHDMYTMPEADAISRGYAGKGYVKYADAVRWRDDAVFRRGVDDASLYGAAIVEAVSDERKRIREGVADVGFTTTWEGALVGETVNELHDRILAVIDGEASDE